MNHYAHSLVRGFAADFLAPFRNEDVRCWIAGGAIRELAVENKLTTDIDIFGPEPERIMYAAQKLRWALRHTSENAYNYIVDGREVDIIRIPFKTMEDTVKWFDFTCCAAASDGETVTYGSKFWEDNTFRRLVLANLPHPVSTLRRVMKYQTKGYSFCPDETVKLAKAIHALESVPDNPVLYVD